MGKRKETLETIVDRHAAAMLRAANERGYKGSLRRLVRVGKLSVMVSITDWQFPTAAQETEPKNHLYAGCAELVLATIRRHGKPMTAAAICRELKMRGYAKGSITKVLADLTATGELVNPRDHRGYRLPGMNDGPGLFDEFAADER